MPKLTQSYVHGASSVPLIGQTLGAFFDEAARRWGKCDALIVRHQQVRWTYEELRRKVDDFAAGLLALGLEPGDRVGIWFPPKGWFNVRVMTVPLADSIRATGDTPPVVKQGVRRHLDFRSERLKLQR